VARDIKVAFGQRVRGLRESHDWSQEEMGEASGMHWTYIGQVERGERNLTLQSIQKISRAFKVKISVLFEGID